VRRTRLAHIDVGGGHEAAIWEYEDGSTRWEPGVPGWFVGRDIRPEEIALRRLRATDEYAR
jgi:hypothetical protein